MPAKPRVRDSAAARAATALLAERVKFIEDLDTALAAEQAAHNAVKTAQQFAGQAAAVTAQSYRAAVEAGWTPGELRQLGYGERRAPRTPRDGPPTPTSGSAGNPPEAGPPGEAVGVFEPVPTNR